MSLPSEHKALIFVGAVAVLGAGVRVVRASSAPAVDVNQPALDHQMSSADSSAHAASGKVGGRGRGRGGGFAHDTTHRRRGARGGAPDTTTRAPAPSAPMDKVGYIGGRLDLDRATAAQVDSLPGVLPGMAKRIVADRIVRGPFLTLNGLRRVSGVGPAFIAKIDSLVMFSGTVVQPNWGDTVIPRRKFPRSKSTTHLTTTRTTGAAISPWSSASAALVLPVKRVSRRLILTLHFTDDTMRDMNSVRAKACLKHLKCATSNFRGSGARSSA